MAILPVSSVSLKNYKNNINFGQKVEDRQEKIQPEAPKKASNMVKVPVIVLMAMSPAMINGTMPTASAMTDNKENVELLAYAAPTESGQHSYRTYVTRKTYLEMNSFPVKKSIKFKMDNKNYTMYWKSSVKSGPKNNVITMIDIVPDGYVVIKSGTSPAEHTHTQRNNPPSVRQFVYHKLPNPDDSFIGAIVTENTCDNNGNNRCFVEQELRLPDHIGEQVIDLITDNALPLSAKSSLKGFKTVNTAKLEPKKVTKYD